MSASQLSAVLFDALADEHFRHSLLTAPDEALTRYDLLPHELDALASIRASTIEEFAAGMATWLSDVQPPSRRPAMAVCCV
jgi:hypothetical protein